MIYISGINGGKQRRVCSLSLTASNDNNEVASSFTLCNIQLLTTIIIIILAVTRVLTSGIVGNWSDCRS